MSTITLEQVGEGTYICQHIDSGIGCVFERGAFNETQRFVWPDDDDPGLEKIAEAARVIGEWLAINHPDLVRLDIRLTIGSKIRQRRQAIGMTQEQLADRCGVGQGHIARIERGVYAVKIDTLQTIAGALGLEIDLVEQ